MALERRGNRDYYYRKERRNGRVTSIYAGAGEMAQELSREAEELALEAARQRREFEDEKATHDEVERMIDNALSMAPSIVAAFYLANGYYPHQRTWRRRQNG